MLEAEKQKLVEEFGQQDPRRSLSASLSTLLKAFGDKDVKGFAVEAARAEVLLGYVQTIFDRESDFG